MNAAARRLTDVAKALGPVARSDAPVGEPEEGEALPAIEAFDAREALAARIMALSGEAQWVAIHLGERFTVATDAARLSMVMGGDLLSPGITDEDAWTAALPLLEAFRHNANRGD